MRRGHTLCVTLATGLRKMKHIDAIYAFGKKSVLCQCGVYDNDCLQRGSFYFGPVGKNPSVATSYAHVSRLCFRSKATTRLRVTYPQSRESFPWLALLSGAKLIRTAVAAKA